MFAILVAAVSLVAAFDTDIDMTAQDIQQTGISKLSKQEKAALQTWIDKNYTKKGLAQGSKTGKKQAGPILQDNLKNGHLIRLSDGSLWEINPIDTPITQGWVTAVEIKIESSGDAVYPYKLTNSLTGSSVMARKATGSNPVPTPKK
jgi:hypothetical protein